MKYYSREITIRKPINRFGRLGYVLALEFVKTNEIDNFNKGKKIKFCESPDAKKYLLHKTKDVVYVEEKDVVSRHASNYKR